MGMARKVSASQLTTTTESTTNGAMPTAVKSANKNPPLSSRVKVPRNSEENRELKAGYVEDDNEDIAYLNFRLIYPVGICTAFSVGFFLFACMSMEWIEHLSFERFALNQLLFSYGKTKGFCNNTFPYEEGMWPSFLRQVEMKVLTNIFFRVAVCVPMAVRIFVALCLRSQTRELLSTRENVFFYYSNEISGVIIVAEVFSLGLFSIVTIRFDYPEFYDVMLGVFIASATAYMFLRTVLSFLPDRGDSLEQIATLVKLVSTILFGWTASQVFQTHQAFIQAPGCHGYVPPRDAIIEYIAITSYVLFQLSQLVEIRDMRFICYPRTCSGECEPLRPENFIPPPGCKEGECDVKYKYCRAFEYRQRQLLSTIYEDTTKGVAKDPGAEEGKQQGIMCGMDEPSSLPSPVEKKEGRRMASPAAAHPEIQPGRREGKLARVLNGNSH